MNKLTIYGFKCFKSIEVEFSKLTLLTGWNAAGKSTVIQALLLLSQGFRNSKSNDAFPLSGELLDLGKPSDVFNDTDSYGDAEIVFGITVREKEIQWHFGYPENRSHPLLLLNNLTYSILPSKEDSLVGDDFSTISELSSDIIFLKDLVYLSSKRILTNEGYPVPTYYNIVKSQNVSKDDFPEKDVGVKGQYAAWLYEQYKEFDINIKRMSKNESAQTLRRQVNAWMSYILPNAEVHTASFEMMSTIQLSFRSDGISKYRKPCNIGYGLTYIFPIVLACLIASDNQLLIIDSPELHLHPQAQSRMGEFLSKISNSGVNLIIETHSDHILNGLRLAVKNKDMPPEKIKINFFTGDFSSEEKTLICPNIDNEGRLDIWPEGFFDQTDKDLSKLIGW
jgi:predicted ATPase